MVHGAQRFAVCTLAVTLICSTFPAPRALADPGQGALLAQAYQGPTTGYPPPPAYAPLPASAEPGVSQGAIDGHADAGTRISATGWFFVGFFLSWIGIILGYTLKPGVDGVRLVGKSPAYVTAYTEAYQIDGRAFRGIHAVYGCVTSGAILLGLTIALGALIAAAASVGGG